MFDEIWLFCHEVTDSSSDIQALGYPRYPIHLVSNAEQSYTARWLSSASSLKMGGSTKVLKVAKTQGSVSGVSHRYLTEVPQLISMGFQTKMC